MTVICIFYGYMHTKQPAEWKLRLKGWTGCLVETNNLIVLYATVMALSQELN